MGKKLSVGDLVEVTTRQFAGSGIGAKAIVLDVQGLTGRIRDDIQVQVLFVSGMYQGELTHRAARYLWRIKE